jgi:hypothetical protein
MASELEKKIDKAIQITPEKDKPNIINFPALESCLKEMAQLIEMLSIRINRLEIEDSVK